MWNTLSLFFLLAISSSRLNFVSTQVKLRDDLKGSRDFAFEGPLNDGTEPRIEKTTTSTTTVSPELQKCVDTCLANATITDSRPVCGSDRVTYNNNEHFTCTIQCGELEIHKLYTDECNDYY